MSKKKKAIPKAIKALVWNTHIGESNGIGLCQCCFTNEIKQMSFQCGHVISEYNGGSVNVNNMKPICSGCNFSMGTRNMDEYMKTYGLKKNDKTPIKITITDNGDIIDESKIGMKPNDTKIVKPTNDKKIIEKQKDNTIKQNNHIQSRMNEINKQTLDLPKQKEIAQHQLKEMIMSKQNDSYNNNKINNKKLIQITIVDSDTSSDSESFDDIYFLKDYKTHINKLSNKSRKLTKDEIEYDNSMKLIYDDIRKKFNIYNPYNSMDNPLLRSNSFAIESKNIEIDNLIKKIKDHNNPNKVKELQQFRMF